MTLHLSGSVLRASADDRIVTYLLCPFGEPGRTNLGKVTLTASSLSVPDDVSSLTVNVEHQPTTPVGKFARIEATAAGYEADVRFLATRAGDDALTEAREGVRTGISVEVEQPVIRGGQMLAGRLSGAGVCVTPAFPSALMVAADAGELPDHMQDTESTSESTEEVVIDGVTYVRKTSSTYKTETTPKGKPDGDDDADKSAQEGNEMGDSLTATAAAAAGVQPMHATGADPATGNMSAGEAFRMLASAMRGTPGPRKDQLLAALTNVVHDDGDNDGDGLGEITAAPGWLGQVWDEAAYERQFIPLVTSGTLTSYREKGFRIGTLPKVAKYAGNKAEVPTGGMTATPVDYLTERWAHAADIDRRYIDFGDSDVLRAFTEAQVASYKEETDLDVAAQILTNATAYVPGTTPSGANPALVALVDGLLNLIGKRLQPSFAIIGLDLYRPWLFLKKDDVSAFLSESFGLKSGVLENVKIVPTALPAYAGHVVVGDGRTVKFKELGGGSPVRVEAEHVANGGKDFGVFGYTSFQVLKPGGVVKVDLVP